MTEFTLIELHVDDARLSPSIDVGGAGTDDGETDESAGPDGTDGEDGNKRAALLGTLVLFILVAGIVRYLSGDDETPDVEIETADDGAVGVAVDADDE